MQASLICLILLGFSILLPGGLHAAAPAREQLPRVKITGQLSAEQGYFDGNRPSIDFQYWSLGDNFICRRQWIQSKAVPPGPSPSPVHGPVVSSGATVATITQVPVVSYEPAGSSSSPDFPIRYYEAHLPDTSWAAVPSMSGLDGNAYAKFPYWILQRELLAARGLPSGTTGTRTVDQDGSFRDSYWFPSVASAHGSWTEELARIARTDKVSFEIWTNNFYKERPSDRQRSFAVHLADFDTRYPLIPRHVQIENWHKYSWYCKADTIDPIPESATHDSILLEATKGLKRVFSQNHKAYNSDWRTTKVPGLDGTEIHLSRFADKTLLRHVWTSWVPDNEKKFREVGVLPLLGADKIAYYDSVDIVAYAAHEANRTFGEGGDGDKVVQRRPERNANPAYCQRGDCAAGVADGNRSVDLQAARHDGIRKAQTYSNSAIVERCCGCTFRLHCLIACGDCWLNGEQLLLLYNINKTQADI